ncbi:Os03g0413850 [Oryza sativa Japonica Group]|uniref:Os03g0413850 protein n=1 Tax=Oryza sativa subsp. japonica TaxID=39947 RepID=A0A0P0VZC8_ORYSJ|nr:Os03g0413850 [Oryza sativa Japonica Group]
MHTIAEVTGGTFSFIENEAFIQDGFAQCIGGLLSVAVQELHFDAETWRGPDRPRAWPATRRRSPASPSAPWRWTRRWSGWKPSTTSRWSRD